MKNAEEVQGFERLDRQLHSKLTEISELSKKRPNDGLNKFKLKFVNVLLESMNGILGEQKPFQGFETSMKTTSQLIAMSS